MTIPQYHAKEIEYFSKLFEITRYLLIIFTTYSMINVIALSSEIINLKVFLLSFNWGVLISLAILICFMDYRKNEFIYGNIK